MSTAMIPPTAIVLREQSSHLAKLDQARQMLAESRTLPELKKIRDLAEAAKVYAVAANLGRESQNLAAEIALLAARKAGDILVKLERAKPKPTGGRVPKSEAKSEYALVLEESGTPEREAQRWQEIAKIPDETFNDYITQSKELNNDICRAGLSAATSEAIKTAMALRTAFEERIDAYLADYDYAQSPTANPQRRRVYVDWQMSAVEIFKRWKYEWACKGVLTDIVALRAFKDNWSEDQRLSSQALIGSIAFLSGMRDPWLIGPRPIGMKPYTLGF